MEDTRDLPTGSASEPLDFDEMLEKARLDMLKAGVLEPEVAEGPGPAVPVDDASDEDDDGDDDEDDSDAEDDDDDEGSAPESDESDGEQPEEDDVAIDAGDEESDEPAAVGEDGAEPEQPVAEDRQRKRGRTGRKLDRLEGELAAERAEKARLTEQLTLHQRNAQAVAAQLAAQQAAQAEIDSRVAAEVEEFLGGEEAYREKLKSALDGDFAAAEDIKEWDRRRDDYKKMKSRAEQVVHERAGEVVQRATSDLAGIDQQLLQTASLFNIVRHLYFTGLSNGRNEGGRALEQEQSKAKAQIEKLKRENERLKARLSGAQTRAVSKSAPTPLSGGRPSAAGPKKSLLDQLLDPKTGLPTDESEHLIRTGRVKFFS